MLSVNQPNLRQKTERRLRTALSIDGVPCVPPCPLWFKLFNSIWAKSDDTSHKTAGRPKLLIS